MFILCNVKRLSAYCGWGLQTSCVFLAFIVDFFTTGSYLLPIHLDLQTLCARSVCGPPNRTVRV